MGRPISYEMVEMFVDSPPAFPVGGSVDNGSGHIRLDFIQSHDLSFTVERSPLKQIGSSELATRQTQLAPDVNFSVEYLLNNGWNENFIGLNISTGSYSNPFSNILTTVDQDRNFYLFITDRAGSDSNVSDHGQFQEFETSYYFNDNKLSVLGIGNCYLSNYNINLNVNGLAQASCDFIGANAEIRTPMVLRRIENPAVNTTGSGQLTSLLPSLWIFDSGRAFRYYTGIRSVFDSGCPYYGCSVSGYPVASSGLKFGFDFANFQSLDISIPFERKALYGFGNNHPSYRKIQKPIVGTISLVNIVDTFQVTTLAQEFENEDKTISGFNFDITFGNRLNKPKLGIKIQNARLDSYSISQEIGPVSQIQTSWSFEINESTGILMSGSYRLNAGLGAITESINPFGVTGGYANVFFP